MSSSPCCHYWVIRSPRPDRRKSKGTCRYCGEERYFANYERTDSEKKHSGVTRQERALAYTELGALQLSPNYFSNQLGIKNDLDF